LLLRQVLGAPTAAPSKPWSVGLLAIAVAGLLAGVLLIYSGLLISADVSGYRSAVSCRSPSDALTAEHCIYTGPATLTGSTRQQKLSVDFVFSGLTRRGFTATFATDREPPANSISTGSSVTAELWDGHITKFAAVGTVDDPDYFAMNNLVPGIIFALVSLLATWWGIGFIRIAWRTPPQSAVT
jgi:hypothetical protein